VTARRQTGRGHGAAVDAALAAAYPDATCELAFRSPYELLVATILSAQCTDARVNMVTPALFARFPDAAALAQAETPELETLIRSTGFYRNKAKALLGMARAVLERHGGEIHADMDALTQLPGVGRKTANVILGTAFGRAVGVVVDTHVSRLSQRQDLMRHFPESSWIALGHRLILHGRRVCTARTPACARCPLEAVCPKVGV
jgi:endonuclease III